MLLLLAGSLVVQLIVWGVSEMAVEALPLRAGQTEDDVRSFMLLPIVALVSTLVVTTVTAWRTYCTRRHEPAAVLLVGLAIAMSVAPPLLMVAFGHLVPSVPAVSEPWAASDLVTARIPLDQAQSAKITLNEMHGPDQSGPGVELEAPLLLDGLPNGYVASVWLRDIVWRAGKREVTEPFGFGFSDRRRGQVVSFSTTDQDWTVPASFSWGARENWLVFLRLPAATYRRHRNTPGHYSATAVFTIHRLAPLGSQPLRAGASVRFDSSTRFDVVTTRDTDGACAIELRHSGLDRLFDTPRDAALGYRIEDASGRRLIPEIVRERRWYDTGSLAMPPFMLPMPLGLQQQSLIVRAPDTSIASGAAASAAGAVGAADASMAGPPAAAARTPARPISCADLRLSGVHVSLVGTLTRRIELPNLVLGSLESSRP